MNFQELYAKCNDPLILGKILWPKAEFFKEQREMIYSVERNIETYVVAANKVGKDYTAGFIALTYFLRHRTCKILSTSATEKHLITLWGEIDRWIRTSTIPLTVDKGGPLIYTNRNITRVYKGQIEKDSFISGLVVSSDTRGEGLSGHHADYTLGICDESSGIPNVAYEMMQGWAKRFLAFGNPNSSAPTHFFRKAIESGDLIAS